MVCVERGIGSRRTRRGHISVSGLAAVRLMKALQHRATNKDRASTIDRDEAVFQPMPDGVSVNAEELCDFSRVVAT